MKHITTFQETFPLTGEAISAVCGRLNTMLADAVERREQLRLRLAVEEVLSFWQKRLGTETVCKLWCGSPFGQRSIRISALGSSENPNLCEAEDELGTAKNIILEKLGIAPAFSYEKGMNQVTIHLSAKEVSQLVWIGVAMVLAVGLGFLSLLLPVETQKILADDLAMPALGMLMGALSGVAMPMIFFSICISITNIGDIATLSKIGKKFLLRMLGVTVVVVTLAIMAVAWMFPITTGSGGKGSEFQVILSMLLDMVPKDILSPFVDGNVTQIIFLGGCFGVALLMLGERGHLVGEVFKQLDQTVSLLMAGINKLIPVFVFLTFYRLCVSGVISRLGGVVKIIVLVVIALFLMLAIFTAVLRIRLRVKIRVLLSKLLPAFLIALSTASSMASYPIRLESCKKQLGVDEQMAHFCVPLAQALFKPSAGIFYCFSALFIAAEYEVPLSFGWLFLCLVVTCILTVATPPVPGGAKIAFMALFTQLGIPAEGLMLALTADTLLDFFWTATNTYVQMVLTVLCCDELGLVDRVRLASPE